MKADKVAKTTTKRRFPGADAIKPCKYCGVEVTVGQYLKHCWDNHRPEMEEQASRGGAHRWAKSDAKREEEAAENEPLVAKEPVAEPPPAKPKREKIAQTITLEEANVIAFVPKELRTTSTLLQMAKVVTEREWGWPVLEIGDWIDTYLFYTMKQRGIILGGYQVIERGDGHASQ